MAQVPVKALAVGSVSGLFSQFFNKLSTIDAKHGKFDLVLCVGDFFGEDDNTARQLLDGELEPPIECYIMQGEKPLPEIVVQHFANTGGDLCKNLFLLSKSGTITTAQGLRIGCLGGIYDQGIYTTAEAPPGFLSPYFSAHTTERLISNALSQGTNQSHKSFTTTQSSATSSQFIDIFITNTWPQSIPSLSAIPQDLSPVCAPPLDDVIRRIRPRYHFTSGGERRSQFWEREPYVWEEDSRVSRFISLGAFGSEIMNGKKPRWFYAFTIHPNSTNPPATVSLNITKNPFLQVHPSLKRSPEDVQGENYIFGDTQAAKRQKNAQTHTRLPIGHKCRRCESTDHIAYDCPNRLTPHEGYICRVCNQSGHFVRDCPTRDAVGDTGGRRPREGYVCRACGSGEHYIEDCLVPNEKQRHTQRVGRQRGSFKEIAPDECWFCLSNPNLAKHLIAAIGAECYLTLPKGQIIPTRSSSSQTGVPGGGHVLIIPIAHYPTYSTVPPELVQPIVEETERYKSSLRAFYDKYGAVLVTFEVGRLSTKGGHAHIHAVPLPARFKKSVEDAFISEGRVLGIDFERDPDAAMESCSNGKGGYFRVDLPDGRKLVHLIQDHIPFNIQFGRQVLVNLIGMPERVDWKACVLSEDEDRTDAQNFKEAFEPFNSVS
ncbi:hypothetical protein AX17_003475 [Amanita inopinata Kibby_2008]|nr:hypothetical protein AX17_003475 [Amanita inopinata Kibby_2008]